MTCAVQLDLPPSLSALLDQGPLALFLDFDGTLVEIASTPNAIKVPKLLAPSLEALSKRLEGRLAIVSGRSLEDLAVHLGQGLEVAQAGSHGAARRLAGGTSLGAMPQALPQQAIARLQAFAEENH